ncbi:Wzz/FepE/Etk N-terminal domain-containing protein [Pseudoalteromonas luteoviolacea]|uniref:Wzz/FepE/Etk N-terminal domain-containing protein n=1 Tax=Pseudoalteromonas luteoviolacea TaxID=43657 RepID=UPI001EED43D8|nr:Wzz/FepE/Etk N-terminal domain-containing protein [Pseudoalteromonas luteoviolacea]MCF6439069.1 Wzz/FepE/Etk N-terminal domain-containing protein [Pseudoalteromonas luteoviolacea]
MAQNNDKIKEFDYSNTNDQIGLLMTFKLLWSKKLVIFIFSTAVTLIGFLFASNLPDVYRSSVLVAPAESNASKVGALNSQLGGIASLTGLSLGPQGISKSDLALQILKSRVFIDEFIEKNDLTTILLAVEGWDENEGYIYNEKIYDAASQTWLVENTQEIKSMAFNKFIEDQLVINQDRGSKFIRISMSHYSPVIAQLVLDKLINDINETIRVMDTVAATNSISYLESTLKTTHVDEMKKILFGLIEKEFQKKMLADVQKEYVFQVIDPAIVPLYPTWPKKVLILLLSFVLGMLFICSYLIIASSMSKDSYKSA